MYKIIYLTAANDREAEKIAESLITEKLCACANFFPIRSVYIWKEELVKDYEIGMLLKTTSKLAEKAISRIKEIHSYDVPAILSLPIASGDPDFLNWIKASVNE